MNAWKNVLGSVAAVCLAVAVLTGSAARAADAPGVPPASGPEKGGLASLYPGDEGIERDPRVLFVEDFETGTIDEIAARWGNISRRENFSFSDDLQAGAPGVRSVRIAENGHLYTHTRGADTMYARFYVKFHEKTGYIHHFVHLMADRTPTPWPKGTAGQTPPGDLRFSTGIEPLGRGGKFPPPGVWNFYSYWHEMPTRWGTPFDGKQELIVPGRWYCIEAMVKANSSPEKADGEQAFWVDGELYGRFTGIRWRTSDELKLNTFWLLHYNTDHPARRDRDPDPDSRVMEVWFNDIVIATEYIGPIQGRPAAGTKKAEPSRSALLTPGLLLPEPGEPIYTQRFDDGAGGFQGGEMAEGGVGGSPAYAFPRDGFSIWNAFSTPVKVSTVVRFKLRPLAEVHDAQVLIWSTKLEDNCRLRLGGLRQGEWNQVEFRVIEARTGWDGSGPSLEGDVLDNLKLIYTGGPDARVLLDDFEILP